MLNTRNLNDRTYGDLMAEAMMQISLMSEEWTNFNPSDPGVTILENLTAFQLLQQGQIDQVPPAVQQKLLKMAGFEARKGRCARVLLSAEGLTEPYPLPVNQKFRVGELCFETNRNLLLKPGRITSVFGVRGEERHDCSWLLDREVRVPAYIFGREPAAGDSVCFCTNTMPEPGEELIFYVTVADRYNRNPFAERGNNTFAALRWECYTDNGFEEMHVRDETGCFLVSGEIRMRLPQNAAAPCPDVPGEPYVIRATLERADYDVKPKLTAVEGFLFEAVQKDTQAICHTFNRSVSANLSSDLLDAGYLMVFGKEEKGSSYRLYEPYSGQKGPGRYYEQQREADGSYTWTFDRRRFGFGPEKLKNAIKVVAYNEPVMRRYYLGRALGYDDQEIQIPAEHIVAESFCIIAKRVTDEGEEIYDFVRPSRFGEEDLTYYLYENEGRIRITDAGSFIGAELYIGSLSVTAGEEGNLRAGNYLTGVNLSRGLRFYNPKPGSGGCFRESIEEVRQRFLQDIGRPYTAVTEDDYEKIVMETPELCIHKVRAYMNPSRNMVRVAVKPGTDEEFPQLSDVYKKAIERQLEDRRLLTTKIEIMPPVYVPVNVEGTVYVKSRYQDNLKQIEEVIRRRLDYVHSERGFGEVCKFNDLFHEIESMDCVEFVYELSLHPQNPMLAKVVEGDVVPVENCLLCAGEISLKIG